MNQPGLNIWTLFFLLAALQGMILGFVILKQNEEKHRGKTQLALLCLLFSLMLLYYVSFWSGYNRHLNYMGGLFLTLPFLFGPLFFSYYQKLQGKRLSAHIKLHYIPFAIHIIWFLILRFFLMDKIEAGTINRWIFNIQALHVLGYALIVLYLANSEGFGLAKWIKFISLSFLAFSIAHLSYYLMVNFGEYNLILDYLISISMSVFIYGLAYFGLVFTGIEYKKNSEPLLTAASIKYYSDILAKLMEVEKLYRDGDLNLENLAAGIGLSKHALSQLINTHFKKNFSDYVNSYRIREAEKLLSSEEYKHLNVIEIAFRVGFNTKVSFYNAFRKKNGISPGEYKNLFSGETTRIS